MNICDSCQYLMFISDPDSCDRSRYNDKKAICTNMKAMIMGSLSHSSEMVNIQKPIWCPCLGRELTDEEKEHYNLKLRYAKFFYED